MVLLQLTVLRNQQSQESSPPPPAIQMHKVNKILKKRKKDCNTFDLLQSLTSSTGCLYHNTSKESCNSSFLEISVLGEEALNLKKVLSCAAVKLQRGLSDLVNLRRKERVSTGAESSTARSCCNPFSVTLQPRSFENSNHCSG